MSAHRPVKPCRFSSFFGNGKQIFGPHERAFRILFFLSAGRYQTVDKMVVVFFLA